MDFEELCHSFSLPPITLRLTLVVLALLFAFTPAEGQSQVIGSLQPIVAALGDDVILPCHVEPPVNVAKLTVEWSKPDLQPDPKDRLSEVQYVHLYRDTRDVSNMMISSYIRRTWLSKDGLRQGDISLKINNVTSADEGRYKCFIPKLKSGVQSSIVRLIVEPNFAKTWTTETPLQHTSLQTSGPTEESDFKGGLSSWSRLIPGGVFLVSLMIVGVGVIRCLTQKSQKQDLKQVPTV